MKEWSKASRPASGPTIITVTLVEGNITAKSSVKAYGKQIRDGVAQARADAQRLHAELSEALSA